MPTAGTHGIPAAKKKNNQSPETQYLHIFHLYLKLDFQYVIMYM